MIRRFTLSRPGRHKPQFVPSFSLGGRPFGGGLGPPPTTKAEIRSRLLSHEPIFVSPLNPYMLTGDDTPHAGDVSDLLKAGYSSIKPFMSEALANFWDNYRGQSGLDQFMQGSMVLIGVANLATSGKVRALTLQALDGVEIPVPGISFLTIAIGPKALEMPKPIFPNAPLADLPDAPDSGRNIPVVIRADLSEFLQRFEMKNQTKRARDGQ